MSGKTEKSKKSKPNRLVNETSTYLLQHAYNPVDWYPWGEEAIARSKAEDKPILLSVGYSACHWCHVMEHESFEDETTAKVMNEIFVNIKVDREERPDIDDIYMKAVQMLTGHGGWPMTVFLTPELKPFYGGTYFPPDDRHGLPSFKRLLLSIQKAWQEQRETIDESSNDITEHLSLLDKVQGEPAALQRSTIEHAIDKLIKVFDYQWGGWGGAPKFPHTGSIALAMRHVGKLPTVKASRQDECLNMVTTTLNRMAYGGMHDQVGGGFSRYSVDKYWLVPHFEKMLYDNALLCRNYLDGYALTERTYWKDVAKGILEFVLRELTTEEGAFYSSLDADSEGEEGKFYVFYPWEIIEALGDDDGKWVNEVYGVHERGNFEGGTTVLHLSDSPEALAKKFNMTVEDFWKRLRPLNAKLLAVRAKRIRPGLDEKVLTSWNSLMISAFIDGYRILQEPKYLDVARRATLFIKDKLMKDGKLLRTYGRGKAKLNGYLDDYAYFVQTLLDMSAVDFDPQWLDLALTLNDEMIAKFTDAESGGFFYTSDDHESLITRTKSSFDGSIPSASSVAVSNLLRIGKLTGNNDYTQKAVAVLEMYAPYLARIPDQFSNMLSALDFNLSNGSEIALVADAKSPSAQQHLFAIHARYLPNTLIIVKDINSTHKHPSAAKSPLLESRQAESGAPTTYICQNYTCDKPITDLNALKEKLNDLG